MLRGMLRGRLRSMLWGRLRRYLLRNAVNGVKRRFPAALAGRALSAFNLVIVAGVFVLQWGIGLGIDAMRTAGLGVVTGYQLAFGAYALATAPSFLWRHGCYRWQRTAVSTQPARG